MGDGLQIPAWTASWVEPEIKLEQQLITFSEDFNHWKVVDLIDQEGSWNWGMLQEMLPDVILRKLVAIPPSHLAMGFVRCV